jgi:hypothetical protein
MAVVAKSPTGPGGNRPDPIPHRPSVWQRWNKQKSLVVFIIGLGVLWVAVSLLLVFEIQ